MRIQILRSRIMSAPPVGPTRVKGRGQQRFDTVLAPPVLQARPKPLGDGDRVVVAEAVGDARAIGKPILPVAPVTRIFSAPIIQFFIAHRDANVKYLIRWVRAAHVR
ncbi:hypothetical protein H7J88_27625 [Mycolicibacterium flavescens]|uniref:hypothetical protein n=1 Tax=Mycolicibacterium flavescens TaxID=1776 RepID=UPI0013F4F6FA|nr:hypothetical protein [Mycolicibacterium flavescens]MCV7283413.1 hypothetical protein [Mycolicibacterium flavescens]